MGRVTDQDPTGQNGNRKRSTRRIWRQLRAAEKVVKRLARSLSGSPTPREMSALRRDIQITMNGFLLETQFSVPPADWYWEAELERPYRQGSLSEIREVNLEIQDAIVRGVLIDGMAPRKLEPQSYVTSQRYRETLNMAVINNFGTFQNLSETTTHQVMQRINSGVQAGLTKNEISVEISGRFDVSRSSAQRIAHTEVNKIYNDARMQSLQVAADQTGLEPMVEHISALIPTTRQSHARRHGNLYTIEEQVRWWDTSPNRINCYCSTRSRLVDPE